MKRIIKIFVIAGMLFLSMQSVFAKNYGEAIQDLSLQIDFTNENVQFDLYYVGEMTNDVTFTWVEEFKQYNFISLDDMSTSGWKTAAETLTLYIQRDGIQPLESGYTDENGELEFLQANQKGLYLVVGQSFISENHLYSIEPSLICLPYFDELNSWHGEVTLSPKYSDITNMDSLTIIKQWDDSNNVDQKRPKSIMVDLLKDGIKVDSVELSQKNNWKFVFENLEKGHAWTCVENEIKNYEIKNVNSGDIVVITNTYSPSKNELPETGTLWWPVPILFCMGCGCLVVGYLQRDREDEKTK